MPPSPFFVQSPQVRESDTKEKGLILFSEKPEALAELEEYQNRGKSSSHLVPGLLLSPRLLARGVTFPGQSKAKSGQKCHEDLHGVSSRKKDDQRGEEKWRETFLI